MKKTKENRGITLIALVITIIVLLILAGVTIATLTGENGILTQAQKAKKENSIAQAREEVDLAIASLRIEESKRNMTKQEKIDFLKDQLKRAYSSQELETMITTSGDKISITHRGFSFKFDENSGNVAYKEPFDPNAWDKNASTEDCFIWLSDDPNSPDYGTVIGYTSKALGYTTLKYPSRCKRVEFTYNDERYSSAGATREDMRSVRNIREVELPGSVTSIGNSAFTASYFYSLEKINIPDSVTTIGEYSFYNTNIKDITIPDSVTSIGNNAFEYCSNLANITIADSVTSIGNNAFYCCYSLNSITIPDSVTNIGSYVFYNCSSLTSITIPGTITNIPNSMFSGCSSLSSITIPESVTSIGSSAFYYCTSLTSITIPENVTSINGYTFYNCLGLTSIDIPKNVTNIQTDAFTRCNNLVSINVSEENTNYSSINGILYNKDQSIIILIPAGLNESNLPSNLGILECPHPHSNNMTADYTKTISGASELRLFFDSQCYLEDAYDYIEIYDGNNTLIYTSRNKGRTALVNKNITVNGDTVRIRLKTDVSVTNFGFKCIVSGVY